VRRGLGSSLLLALAGCASPPVASDVYYRLATQLESTAAAPVPGIELWLQPVSLAPMLQGDRLLAAVGPVRIEPYVHHRWAAPLDLLLDEAARSSLARLGFVLPRVRPNHAAPEVLTLGCHLLEFHELDGQSRWSGRARLQCEVRRAACGTLLWRADLAAEVAAERRHPEAVVVALSRAWDELMQQVAQRTTRALEPPEPLR